MPKYNEKELEAKANDLLGRIKKLDPEAAQYFIDKMSSDETLQPSIIRELKKQLADVEKENKRGTGNSDDDRTGEDGDKDEKGIFENWDL
jgi:hypothetical protein